MQSPFDQSPALTAFEQSFIEQAAPLFGTLTTYTTDWTTIDIRRCLDAVASELTPTTGRGHCHYGVRYGHGQTYGTTPRCFLTALQGGLGEIVRQSDRFPDCLSGTDPLNRQTGACLWPTEEGWFVLEATQRTGEDTSLVHFGLITRGLHTDPPSLRPFFEACGTDLPKRQDLWPLRQLVIEPRGHPALERTVDVADRLATPEDVTGEPTATEHGTNPVYGTPPSALDGLPAELECGVYEPLRRVSSLLYAPAGTSIEGGAYGLERLIVLDPPLQNTLFVQGPLEMAHSRTDEAVDIPIAEKADRV